MQDRVCCIFKGKVQGQGLSAKHIPFDFSLENGIMVLVQKMPPMMEYVVEVGRSINTRQGL
jgi:hypothetical protein